VPSRSPQGETLTLDYEDGWSAVNRLIRQGKSWSGRELNCAFWNAGDGTFVDVSHTTGLAFDHDGRSFARVDWDGDGDLDLWLKNRTAPQVQFLRNGGEPAPSLRLRLVGQAPNTEAIGARVEVLAGGRWRVQERRLGSGYLGQSSEWLHFGLAPGEKLEQVRVRWPDGQLTEHDDLTAGAAFSIEREGARATRLDRPAREIELEASTPTPTPGATSARIPLSQPLVLPQLEAKTFDGRPISTTPGDTSRPRLLTFWASWCPSCLSELRGWDSVRHELQETGLEVLALSVDDDPTQAQEMWANLGLVWKSGMAPDSWVALFDLLQQLVVDRQREMALPTSFLLDGDGRLAVIYRGPVEASRILEDVTRLGAEREAFAGAPFPGRHIGEARPVNLFEVARRLLDLERPGEAMFYIDAACTAAGPLQSKPADAPLIADALIQAGMHFLAQGELAEADRALERARAWSPEDALTWFATARLRATQRDNIGAKEAAGRALELDDDFAPAWELLGSLRLVAQDPTGAIEALERAVGIDPNLAQAWSSLGMAHLTTGEFSRGERAFARRLGLVPNDADAWTGLGVCRLQTGRVQEGITALEKALEIDPKNARALDILRQLERR
jgi:tetratricopeptide (TPR) repeat protein/thiol-disulfide isomerase/thioredoxin